MSQIILHCDLNNFFASVEVILNPELKGKPIAVCGDPEQRRGIVLAKCEIAKRAGVKTGDAVWMAEQKCPGIIIVKPRHKKYSHYSKLVREIYYRYTDRVESFGIDECWLDVTASSKMFGSGEEIAEKLRKDVKNQLGLTISIGVSWNKTYAKIGSDIKKPDAVTIINYENYKQIIYPLPVDNMLFVGRKTKSLFEKLNIKTIGDLASYDVALLKSRLGVNAEKLVACARGEDKEAVRSFHETEPVKSVGNGATIHRDLTTLREIERAIYVLAEEVGTRMRRKGVEGFTVSLSLRNPELKWVGAQASIQRPTHSAPTITKTAMEILDRIWDQNPIRSLRIAVSGLTYDKAKQLDLFLDSQGKKDELSSVFDKVRSKHGSSSLGLALGRGSELEMEFEVIDES